MTKSGVLALVAELESMLNVARPRPWRQGASTHRAVDASGYEVAEFHHGHEQVLTVAVMNALPEIIDHVRKAHDVLLKLREHMLVCQHPEPRHEGTHDKLQSLLDTVLR